MILNTSLTNSGDRPMDGSSQQQDARLGHQRTAQWPASAARRRTACLRPGFLRSSRRGKRLYTSASESSISLLGAGVGAPCAGSRAPVRPANTRRPSGTWLIAPSRTIAWARHFGDVFSLKGHRAALGRQQAGDRVQAVVVLPAPFAPISATTSPSFTSKGNVAQARGSGRNIH